MSVSYTHLDVYKRQIENCNKYIACDKVVNNPGAKSVPKYLNNVLNTAFGIKPATTPSAVPVSYTHLDVYKRQAVLRCSLTPT